MILSIAGSIALRQDSILMAHAQVIRWSLDSLLQDLRRFDEGRRQASLDMPLDVAVEEPDACMVGELAHESSMGDVQGTYLDCRP